MNYKRVGLKNQKDKELISNTASMKVEDFLGGGKDQVKQLQKLLSVPAITDDGEIESPVTGQ